MDISDLSLKVVKLKKKGKFLSLASWGELEIKPGIIEQGEVRDENALAERIKESLNKLKGEKLKTNHVIASLPEKKAFLQVIQMPKMETEELKKAVPFEAENYVPMPIENVYLDFQKVLPVRSQSNHPADHLDILIAAFPKESINFYVYSLKKAGLIPKAIEIESQSISRALIKNELSPSPKFIIDFGRSRTGFIIFSGYSLRFTASVPISSHDLTEAISRSLKTDLAEAEKLKIKYGLEVIKKTRATKKIFEAMTPILRDLVEQIKRYINYYQTHASREHLSSNNREIEKIILCGRGANLKGLTDFLSAELKIPAELGNPWVNILPEPLKEVPALSLEESLGYTAALGLALRGIEK